jgi:pimeloyl-[acyl-carrier protein] methyl ester esterase
MNNRQTLILLSGWGLHSAIWQPAVANLTNYDTRQIDLPLLKQAADLPQAMQELSRQIPDNSIIVAWSMSGLCALYLCQHLPHKCSKLILVCSLPHFATAPDWIGIPLTLAKRFQQKAQSNLANLLTQFIQLVAYPDTSAISTAFITLHALKEQEYQASLLLYLNFLFTADYREFFKNLTLSLHCIFGEADAIIPRQAASQLGVLNKNAKVTVLPAAGHIPFLTHQKIFNELITGILNEST